MFGASLALSGCGGDSPPPLPQVDSASQTSAPPVNTAGKTAPKGKGNLIEGGELSAQERRAAKLKAKQAAGQ
jgi:hypothetical protein